MLHQEQKTEAIVTIQILSRT